MKIVEIRIMEKQIETTGLILGATGRNMIYVNRGLWTLRINNGNMETTIVYWSYIGITPKDKNVNYYNILGLYRDNGDDTGIRGIPSRSVVDLRGFAHKRVSIWVFLNIIPIQSLIRTPIIPM